MTIRYGGRDAALSLAIGLAGLAWRIADGTLPYNLSGVPLVTVLCSVVVLLGGINMLRGRTYLTVDNTAVTIHAQFGPLVKRYPFERWSDVTFDGSRIAIAGKRLPIRQASANSADWHDLKRFVAVRSVGADAVTPMEAQP